MVAIVAASKSASASARRRAPRRDLGVGAVGEQVEHAVVRRRRRAGERAREPQLGAHEPLAHPLAQLAGRHPRERHEQQLSSGVPSAT